MSQSYFPLRWESANDQWWYASPIDWAAANGHYDLVRELLFIDTNLLIKLTSLRRIRKLESVWDDDSRFINVAKGRSFVARNLLMECETKNRKKNSLIRAGYGGWLLYTAASAGDLAFVKELLERDMLLVFGEGEYGVTDVFYAAARSKNCEVFRVLFDCVMKLNVSESGNLSVFREEMVNRALHAAARGGNLDILSELLQSGCGDVLGYRDVQGSTVLHAASGRGQIEVVKYIITSFDIINSRDNQGNIALHIAAFRGHLRIVEALILANPRSPSTTNNSGDTFLHMAVAGFRVPGFRRLDRQLELMRHLINGSIIKIEEFINIQNNEGRTPLHVAVIGNMHSDLVELLMTANLIDLNIRDFNGMAPLDLLSRRPRSASAEVVIKQLVSAGGISSAREKSVISALTTQLRMQGIGSSPGTSFKVSDAEIFLYMGIDVSEPGGRPSSSSTTSAKSEVKPSFVKSKLKILLKWYPQRKEKKEEEESTESVKKWSEREETPTPLRQRFAKSSLSTSKRVLSVRSSLPSPAAKKKFAAGLMHGVIQAMPHLAPNSSKASSECVSVSVSGMSTPRSAKQKEICLEEEASCSNSSVNGGEIVEKFSHRASFVNSKLMNQYFCFGAQGIMVEDSVKGRRSRRMFKRSILSVA